MDDQKGKASTRAKNKYNAANYDSLRIVIPKGAKEALEAAAQNAGQSVNGYVNDAIADKMGVETLKIYSVKITERERIINSATMRPMDDTGLRALDGIREQIVSVEANSPEEAQKMARQKYFESYDPSQDKLRVNTVEFNVGESVPESADGV